MWVGVDGHHHQNRVIAVRIIPYAVFTTTPYDQDHILSFEAYQSRIDGYQFEQLSMDSRRQPTLTEKTHHDLFLRTHIASLRNMKSPNRPDATLIPHQPHQNRPRYTLVSLRPPGTFAAQVPLAAIPTASIDHASPDHQQYIRSKPWHAIRRASPSPLTPSTPPLFPCPRPRPPSPPSPLRT